jgi:hypothetical protein
MRAVDAQDSSAISRWRPAEKLVQPLTKSPRRRTFVGVGLFFAALVLLTLLASFEQVLRDLHPLGGERAGVAALANDLFGRPDVHVFRTVLDTWDRVATAAGASSDRVLALYALTDLVFVVVYTLLVGMLLVMLKNELGPPTPPPSATATPQ